MKPQPDYTNVLHERENNSESEKHLKANKYHFTGQVAVVLSLLQKGVVLTVYNALTQYRIGDLRRRIKDIKDAGVDVSEDWVYDAEGKRTRFKKWYINHKTEASKKEVPYKKNEKSAADYAKEIIKKTKNKDNNSSTQMQLL